MEGSRLQRRIKCTTELLVIVKKIRQQIHHSLNFGHIGATDHHRMKVSTSGCPFSLSIIYSLQEQCHNIFQCSILGLFWSSIHKALFFLFKGSPLSDVQTKSQSYPSLSMHALTALPVNSSLHLPIICLPRTENTGSGIMLSFFFSYHFIIFFLWHCLDSDNFHIDIYNADFWGHMFWCLLAFLLWCNVSL